MCVIKSNQPWQHAIFQLKTNDFRSLFDRRDIIKYRWLFRVQLFSPMFENPFLHPWWGYWKRVSTAILTYVWKSWVPEEHRWGESREDQLAILTHVWNMGETAHRWGESKENQLAILTHVYIHGCWKVSNFTHVYRCTDMTLGLTSLDAEKCLTSPVFTDALTWLWDWLL